MSLSKTDKFKAIETMSNVFQNFNYFDDDLTSCGKVVVHRGKWKPEYFKNSNPLIIELACGRGEYTYNLAKLNSNKNYIGVDIKGNRIYTGAHNSIKAGLNNVGFIRTNINKLHRFIATDEIDEVWITFPDPFPKFPDRNNRLISPRFLDYYLEHFSSKKITYHLKTDNFPLFRYAVGVLDGRSIEIVQCIENIYGIDKKIDDILRISTYYEELHKSKGSQIHYVKWRM